MFNPKSAVTVWLVVLIFAALLSRPAAGAQSTMLMSPYLQAVSGDSIYVLVESVIKDPVTVEYGLNPQLGSRVVTEQVLPTDTDPVTYMHHVKLTGLKANSIYYYRASQGNSSSALATFRSAVTPGSNFRFGIMGDCKDGNSIHDQVAELLATADPYFLLYNGDINGDGAYYQYKDDFFRPNQLALIAKAPFFNATGNHDDWSVNTRAFTQAPASASNDQGYYSFDYGDLHVLVLNREDPKGYKPGSLQYQFAQTDLATTKRKWKIVINHAPAYSAGAHGSDPDMKLMTTNIFEPNQVDLVIAGHNHFYQHSLVNGIHHLVIGSAGADLKKVGGASYVLKGVEDYNWAMVELTPTRLHLVVYNNFKTVLDTFDLTK